MQGLMVAMVGSSGCPVRGRGVRLRPLSGRATSRLTACHAMAAADLSPLSGPTHQTHPVVSSLLFDICGGGEDSLVSRVPVLWWWRLSLPPPASVQPPSTGSGTLTPGRPGTLLLSLNTGHISQL